MRSYQWLKIGYKTQRADGEFVAPRRFFSRSKNTKKATKRPILVAVHCILTLKK